MLFNHRPQSVKREQCKGVFIVKYDSNGRKHNILKNKNAYYITISLFEN